MAGARGLLCSAAEAPTSCSLNGNTQLIDTRLVLDYHEAAPTVAQHNALHGALQCMHLLQDNANKLSWPPTLFLGFDQASLGPRPPCRPPQPPAGVPLPNALLSRQPLRCTRCAQVESTLTSSIARSPLGSTSLRGSRYSPTTLSVSPGGEARRKAGRTCVFHWLRATRRRLAGRLGGCATTGKKAVLPRFFKACRASAGGRAKGTCPLLSVLGPPSTYSRLLSHPLLAPTSPTAAMHPWALHTPASRFCSSHTSHALRVFGS